MKARLRPLMLPFAACLVASAALAAEITALKVGEEVPEFTLNDQAGKEHKLGDYRGKPVVIIFSSQHCPWSRAADSSISELAEKYKDKGVTLLAIDSHNGTSMEQIKSYADEAKVTFSVLKDENNQYADKLGAKQTPEVFIVDKEGKLAYHGAFDNRKAPDQVGELNYVANALDALLSGQEVQEKETKAWGCGISRAS